MASLRAVLFDFFGTLTFAVTRGPGHTAVARELGCDPTALLAVLDSSFRDRCRGQFTTSVATLRWACQQLGVNPPPARIRAAARTRIAAIRADTRLRPDALAALAEVRLRNLQTAVVTDCCCELPMFLPTLPVTSLLDALVYSVEVGECKPHPAMYTTACERLGVEPTECLYIGDGGGEELTGAESLGMTAVQLTAPDLTEHLVFARDLGFTGRTAPSLLAAVSHADLVVAAPA